MPSNNARTHRKRLARAYAAHYKTGYQQAHQHIVAAHQAGVLPAALSSIPDADLPSVLAAAHAHALSRHTQPIPTPAVSASGTTHAEYVSDIADNPDFRACLQAWEDTDEPDSHLMDEVAEWAMRLLAASEDDRPGYDRLEDAAHAWDDLDEHDTDACIDLVESIRSITARDNMRVVEDGKAGHLRVADGRRGHTCADCGNGYATAAVLAVHVKETHDTLTETIEDQSTQRLDWKSLISDPYSPEFAAFEATCAPGDPANLAAVANNLAHAPSVIVVDYQPLTARPAEPFETEVEGNALTEQGHLRLRHPFNRSTRTFKFGAMDSTYAHPDLHRVHPDALGVTIHGLDGNPTTTLRAAFPGDPLITAASQYPLTPRSPAASATPEPCPLCGDRYARFAAADYRGTCRLCQIPHTVTDEIDVAECVRLGLIAGFATTTWAAPQTHTLVGHWEGNTIVVEHTTPGEQQDDRPETGYWAEGLWASHGTGLSMAEVAAHALTEYEECHSIRAALSEDDYTPSAEFEDTACEICGDETDEKDRHGTLMCLDCQE